MKAVMVSIRPEWCELIAISKKTVEVRKTKPKINAPFKCYIYETKGKTETPTFIDEEGHEIYEGRGQVIGEFVCDKLVWVVSHPNIFARHDLLHEAAIKAACLTEYEAGKYANGKDVYGWHISDLMIYDKPKELSEFRHCGNNYHFKPIITRPPQSWCYVEELEDKQ